jgi:arginyl-tRNA synthetase
MAARDLGIEVESGRTLVALSGRRGIEVRADDLIDLVVAKVRGKAANEAAATALAVGAIRYYLQKYSLTQIIAFDPEEALRTTGDTGVYLQYAHARAAGILRKVPDDGRPVTTPSRLESSERALLHLINGYPTAVAEVARSLSLTPLTSYTFALASGLSDFYEHTSPIVRETDAAVRGFRRSMVNATRATLADALHTLGIAAPDHI